MASHLKSLVRRCENSFDPIIRHRGQDYFLSGRVSEPVLSGTGISATVRGTEEYEVRFLWGRYSVTVTCTCPYYLDGELCKHTWALIVKIDRIGMSNAVPGKKFLEVRHFEAFAYEDDTDDEFENDNNWKEYEDMGDDPDLDAEPTAGQNKVWRQEIIRIQKGPARDVVTRAPARLKRFRLAHYAIDPEKDLGFDTMCLRLCHREVLENGDLSDLRFEPISKGDLPLYQDTLDREVIPLLLLESDPADAYGRFVRRFNSHHEERVAKGLLPAPLQSRILTRIADSGRLLRIITQKGKKVETRPLRLDQGPPWKLELVVEPTEGHYRILGQLFRRNEKLPLNDPQNVLPAGFIIKDDELARLDADYCFDWIVALRSRQLSPVPASEADALVEALLTDGNCPPVQWPEGMKWPSVQLTPQPRVVVRPDLGVELRMDYEGLDVLSTQPSPALVDRERRRIVLRDFTQEHKHFQKLSGVAGIVNQDSKLRIEFGHFATAVGAIFGWGWRVEAFGSRLKAPSTMEVKVSSGIDWFDVNATVSFEGISLTLPKMLEALRRRDGLIPLGDGTTGMLPLQWLEKYRALATVGAATDSGLRFTRGQGALVAAWLENESLERDHDFAKLTEAIRSRGQLKKKSPRSSFKGELRPYQKEGLSWLDFLAEVGFGGILADDMGLGKTVQVLAQLDSEHEEMKKHGRQRPSLLVVPKSLLFNWRDEAERFTPNLSVLLYAGADRRKLLKQIETTDLVLITYQTLRQDAEDFRKFSFHYLICDEAQAIKNADSRAHIACRSMKGIHRLAMTGTPVENSALDLMAILDFVSPGLLGRGLRSRVAKASKELSVEALALTELSKALRPFILRRTKNQVLKDLPDKVESVLHCELSTAEMRQYKELRDFYKLKLKREFHEHGVARSKFVVLEALLRLRQAACHPGLIDKARVQTDSTKTETLVAQLKELTAEGHKALVFSQFTSFLDIVGDALDRETISYLRLDGKTSNLQRKKLVGQFQNQSDVRVFLISLKAGGVGLNLTAADYVFILDPWWNPAVERQAIDRSHRIGQKNKVMAYRLIAKDTVEEKILELQQTKREIADALITEDASLLKKLTAEDVELLLS
jgi:superfamily II DNA or RNA helicase